MEYDWAKGIGGEVGQDCCLLSEMYLKCIGDVEPEERCPVIPSH